ncbi:MAG TPA: SpoIID/LytB domain-containing protein, partial [Luteitalea sp.]|nr:SpoIID/LytB domain-containing protein [Luteitalea sp.]
ATSLDRRALETTARRLLGRAFDSGDVPLPLVVLGLDGPRLGLDVWTRGVIAAVRAADDEPRGMDAVVRGLVRATTEGTAMALDDAQALTLAKTGTTLTGERGEGLVVAWRPESDEVVAVRAPGLAGRDAARLARAIWERASREQQPRVRVGRTRGTGSPAATRVESMPLEDYVAGVVAGEGETSLPHAVHEALAVAARSYASAPDGRHAADGYDVCDTTHCQRLVDATAWSRTAAAATRGLVLAVGPTPVAVPYSAACSGTLVAPSDVWGGEPSSLTRVGPDPGAHVIPTWSTEVTADDLARALRLAGHRGDLLRGVRVVSRSRAGHPTRLALDGLSPSEIDATAFRHIVGRVLGWDLLKSYVWEVIRTARGYRFDGRGKGHGAGFCVRGAAALAERGADAQRLLSTYVPGARVVALQDRVTLRLPHDRLGEGASLSSVVRRQLADLRRRLGVMEPRQVEIRVHPTVEAYQRATGRAWWTSAATTPRGAAAYRVDLAPAAAEATVTTLNHELVHVLTMGALQLGPPWAGEGLATLTIQSSDRSAPAPAPVRCPSAEAVRRPGRDAIRDTYVAASRCAGAALPQGLGTWRRLVGLADAPSGTGSPVYEQ